MKDEVLQQNYSARQELQQILSRKTPLQSMPWSKHEVNILMQYYLTKNAVCLRKLLPKRSWRAICWKARELGLRKKAVEKRWEPWEDEILRQNYSTSTRQELQSLLPHRTLCAVNNRAISLGLRKTKETLKRISKDLLARNKRFQSLLWKPEEIQILLKNYATLDKPSLQRLIPKRSWEAICRKARELGLQRKKLAQLRYKVPNLPKWFWAYFAGIVDGEGTITIVKSRDRKGRIRLQPQVYVTNNNLELLEELKKKLKIGNILRHGKNGHRLIIRGIAVTPILLRLKPFLIIKKQHADIVLRFLEERKSKSYNDPLGEEEHKLRQIILFMNTQGEMKR